MTLFGTTLDGAQISSLVGLLAALVFWVFVLRRERGYARWFRDWEAGRKARRDAELAAERGEAPDAAAPSKKTGPWG